MKSSRVVVVIVSTVCLFEVAAAQAARVDMNDPRRALGREDDVRVDAELISDTVSSGSPVGITYQVQNLSNDPIAIADKVCEVSYDADAQAIVVSIGSDVPKAGVMPKLVVVAPNEKKTFTAGGVVHVTTPITGSPFTAVPHIVQISVNILRHLDAFRPLIEQQTRATAPIALTDAQFEKWLENNDTIFLNDIPVQYSVTPRSFAGDASQRDYGTSGSN
jgi:hypothetical protein